jgi:hypothetical protein
VSGLHSELTFIINQQVCQLTLVTIPLTHHNGLLETLHGGAERLHQQDGGKDAPRRVGAHSNQPEEPLINMQRKNV